MKPTSRSRPRHVSPFIEDTDTHQRRRKATYQFTHHALDLLGLHNLTTALVLAGAAAAICALVDAYFS